MTTNVDKGRYWDKPWSLVDGCTPCSPGCDNCWSMAMGKRFHKWPDKVTIRPDRLDVPLKTKKPTVFSVWNDLFHEDVPYSFIHNAFWAMLGATQHTYLVLTKRVNEAARAWATFADFPPHNVWSGLTVCNQQEADEKIPVFLQTPGKKFLSIEPMLGEIGFKCKDNYHKSSILWTLKCPTCKDSMYGYLHAIDAVILGGETGPKARPIHPDWVRSVRDQCAAAGVPFFFKGWGKYIWRNGDCHPIRKGWPNRLLDGRTHNDLPWQIPQKR